MEKELQLKDLHGFIQRRKRVLIVTFSALFLIGFAVSIALPPIYRSQAKIMIQGQEVSSEFIRSTVTGYAEERIKAITEQILSSDKLADIAKQVASEFHKNIVVTSETISDMKKNIEILPITTSVTSEHTGRPIDIVTAFTVSFDDRNPYKAQKIARRLSDLFIQEDIKSRQRQASGTTAFLQEELDKLKKQTRKYEDEIRDFKEKHIGILPEYTDVNLRTIESLERKLDSVEVSIRSIQEKYITLKTQIASVDPMLPVKIGGEQVSTNPYERLKNLRMKLVDLRTTLSDQHPDVKKVKREIKELSAQLGEKKDQDSIYYKQLQTAKASLAKLKETYGPNHPDVIRKQKEIDAISAKLKGDGHSNKEDLADVANNPAYINLKAQILAAKAEWDSLLDQRNQLNTQVAQYRQKLEKIPGVESQYSEMTRDYERTKKKYDDLFDKLMEAKVAVGMQTDQKGERFELIDSANLPLHPYKPNRIALILICLILSFIISAVVATLREAMDRTVNSADDLSAIVGAPVLSVLKMVQTYEEKRQQRARTAFICLSILASCLLATIVLHFTYMPIGQMFQKIFQRLLNV
jgi:polysaccharide biosynthesis transport protein